MPSSDGYAERIPAVVSDAAYSSAWATSKYVPTQQQIYDKIQAMGITIGNPVTGGGANCVLYEDGSQNLGASSEFSFDGHGAKLTTKMDLSTYGLKIQPDFNNNYYGSTDFDMLVIDAYTGSTGNYGFYTSPVVNIMKVLNHSNFPVFRIGRIGQIVSNTDASAIDALPSGQRSGYTIIGDASNAYYNANVSDALRITGINLTGLGLYSTGDFRLLRVDTGIDEAFHIYRDGKSYFYKDVLVSGAQFKVIRTTEQLRLGYDVSNYLKVTVGATGNAEFNLVGTSPTFLFSKPVQFYTGSGGVSWLPYTDGKNYLSASETIFRSSTDAVFLTFAPTLLTFVNSLNLAFGTGAGTKIGTADSQKIGVWGNTPIVRPPGYEIGNWTERRDFDPTSNTVSDLMDFACTMCNDLQNIGWFAAV